MGCLYGAPEPGRGSPADPPINLVWSEAWYGEGDPEVLRLDYAPISLRQAADDCARLIA